MGGTVAASDWVLGWAAAWSAIAFVTMAVDKGRARGGGSRIRERTLLLIALVGGSPGVAAGMALVRHKTRKAGFLVALLLIVSAQLLAVLLWSPRI